MQNKSKKNRKHTIKRVKKNRKHTIKRKKKNRKHTIKRQRGGFEVKATTAPTIKGLFPKGLIDSRFMEFRGSEVILHVNNRFEESIWFKLEPKTANKQDIKSRMFMTYVAGREFSNKYHIGKQKWVPVFNNDWTLDESPDECSKQPAEKDVVIMPPSEETPSSTNSTDDEVKSTDTAAAVETKETEKSSKVGDDSVGANSPPPEDEEKSQNKKYSEILKSIINIIEQWFTIYDGLKKIIDKNGGKEMIHCKVQGKLAKLIKKRKEDVHNETTTLLNSLKKIKELEKSSISAADEPTGIANLPIEQVMTEDQEQLEKTIKNLKIQTPNIETMVNTANQLFFGMKNPDINPNRIGTLNSHQKVSKVSKEAAIQQWKQAVTEALKIDEIKSDLKLNGNKIKLNISELKAVQDALIKLKSFDTTGVNGYSKAAAHARQRQQDYINLENQITTILKKNASTKKKIISGA